MKFLLKWFSFSGRATRSEYWLSTVISFALPIISFLLLTAMLFALSRQLHGDPLQVTFYYFAGSEEMLSEEQKEALGHLLRIDAPIVLQYLRWTSNVFFEGNLDEWMTTGKPMTMLGMSDEYIDNYNVRAQNITLIAVYLLGGIWLISVLLILIFWYAVVVRRLRDVGATAWHLLWFFIPGLNLLALLILGVKDGDKFREITPAA